MLANIEANMKSKLEAVNESAKNAKEAANAVNEVSFDAEKMDQIFDVVDRRINKVAKELRKEMAAERKLVMKQQKNILLLNIGIATMAVIAFVFNRMLG